MKRKRILTHILLIIMLTALTGCGMKSGHKRAVTEAITSYTDCYLEVVDLGGQMRRQAQALTGYEDAASYTLDIRIPDYSLIDVAEIDYAIPAVDYANADYESYLAELLDAFQRGAESYAVTTGLNAYTEMPMKVDLSRVDGTWQAEICLENLRAIRDRIEKTLHAKLLEPDAMPVECSFVRVAEQKTALIGSLIEGDSYIDAILVTGVDELGGGEYRLNFRYPDPADVFRELSKPYIASFRELYFGTAECQLDPGDYSAANSQAAEKSGSVMVRMNPDGVCTVADGRLFQQEFKAAKESAQAAASRAVNDKWGVPEVEPPAVNTRLYGSGSGSVRLVITLLAGAPATYIRMMRVESDFEETGTLEAGTYMLPNNGTFTLYFKPGTYKVLVAWGDVWYGPEYMFGPDGNYAVYHKTERLPSGTIWTWYNVDRPWDGYIDFERTPYDAARGKP